MSPVGSNPRFTKPIDAGTTEFSGRAADVVVTLEDHVLMGGYGSAVLELFSEKNVTTPVVRISWPEPVHRARHDAGRDSARNAACPSRTPSPKVKAQFSEAPAEAEMTRLVEVA